MFRSNMYGSAAFAHVFAGKPTLPADRNGAGAFIHPGARPSKPKLFGVVWFRVRQAAKSRRVF